MKRTHLALIVLAIGVAALATTRLTRNDGARPPDDHRRVRQIVLYYTLSRVEDPVIVLGDSIVEAAMLPGSACGHPIVNAGLSGASTASDLGAWLAEALGQKRAAAIVVALGTNDALAPAPGSPQAFEGRYVKLLDELSKFTPRLLVLAIPPVEARERVSADLQKQVMVSIDGFNAVLPGLAARTHAAWLPLPEMPSRHTIDGVHLDAAGYRVWDQAILQGLSANCGG